MTMFLQHTSSCQKRLIKEALNLRNKTRAKRAGWKFIGDGYSCTTYRKGSVVVKFFSWQERESIKHSLRFYLAVPPYYRRYLARIFAIADDRIIQKYVSTTSRWTQKNINSAKRLKKHFRFYDIDIPNYPEICMAHNICIRKGVPVVYDFTHERVPRRRKKKR